MELKRVVVTGLGALTPIGNNLAEYWDALKNGRSGAAPIRGFDASKFKTTFACELKGFDGAAHFDRKEIRTLDLYSHYALVAAEQAVMDAGLSAGEGVKAERAGVIWGSGIGGIHTFWNEAEEDFKGDETRINI